MVGTMRNARYTSQGRPSPPHPRRIFHRHSEISMDGGSDGTIIDQYRYMLDASYMDWVGCCDHDNGGGREYSWWTTQKLTDIFHSPGKFVPCSAMSAVSPTLRGIAMPCSHSAAFALCPASITRPDPVAKAPDTQMFYRYLRQFNGIVAMHTSGTGMGTDWRDNDPITEPVVEIYQGNRQNCRDPRRPAHEQRAGYHQGGMACQGFVSLALEMGYKMAFQASSNHISTHQSYCNILVRDFSRQGIMDAFQKRHVYGATDHILADFRSGDHIMGDAFTSNKAPEFRVKLEGTAPFAKVVIVKDNKYVYSAEPKRAKVEFTWRDTESAPGKTSYYYVRGEQQAGEVVWVSPMWVTRN